mmetsp:Transcript_29572/g.45146  ORF Transcript_29572/g.45146 Transcript_29572/m.45146 type:complete len:322 (-) Transcript_29572:392-1357(-)
MVALSVYSSEFFLVALISFSIHQLSPSVIRPTFREALFTLVGALVSTLLITFFHKLQLLNRGRRERCPSTPGGSRKNVCDDAESSIIQTLEQLRTVLPPGLSGSGYNDAKKVIDYLDDQMIGFIQKSPLLQFSTVDANGLPFVSPKGDQPGFVTVMKDFNGKGNGKGSVSVSGSTSTSRSTLIIPDRPGNRLLFGLQNILDNPNVSILFEIPGSCTTLRCGGSAYISTDLGLLQDHVARKCTPKVVIVVNIKHAFFHCAKAYMRSGIWDPSTWPSEEYQVKFGRYFAPKGSLVANRIDRGVMDHYAGVKKAIDGEGEEMEH